MRAGIDRIGQHLTVDIGLLGARELGKFKGVNVVAGLRNCKWTDSIVGMKVLCERVERF